MRSIREATKTCLKQPWRNWTRDIRSTRRSVIIYMRSLLFTRRRKMMMSPRLTVWFPPHRPLDPAQGIDRTLVTQFGAMEQEQEQEQCLQLHHREVAETAKVPSGEISHWMTRSPPPHLLGAGLSRGVLAEVQVGRGEGWHSHQSQSDWMLFRWRPRPWPQSPRGEKTQYQLWEEETSPSSSQESFHQRQEDQEEDQRRWYQGNHWISHRRCF